MSKNPDIIVIGAGIIGSISAWRLAQAGFKVTVLERNAPASEASQAALGILTFHAKLNMPDIFHQLCYRSQPYYKKLIDELSEITREMPNFQQGGSLKVAFIEEDLPEIEDYYRINKALGVNVEWASVEESLMLAPGLNPKVITALFFENDAWVDNTALTLTIVEAAKKAGVTFQKANVRRINSQAERVTGVETDKGSFSADMVILSAGCWSGLIKGVPPIPIFPVRGQALAVNSQPIRRVVMTSRGYMVPKGTDQMMIGATEEPVGFEEKNTLEGIESVAKAGLEMAPSLQKAEFLGAWAGLRPGTADKLPFIGPFPDLPNLIAATGHFRNGILLAPFTADIIRSVVTGEKPVIDISPLSPGRQVNQTK